MEHHELELYPMFYGGDDRGTGHYRVIGCVRCLTPPREVGFILEDDEIRFSL